MGELTDGPMRRYVCRGCFAVWCTEGNVLLGHTYCIESCPGCDDKLRRLPLRRHGRWHREELTRECGDNGGCCQIGVEPCTKGYRSKTATRSIPTNICEGQGEYVGHTLKYITVSAT